MLSRSFSFLSFVLLNAGLICASSNPFEYGLNSFVSRPDIQAPKWNVIVYPRDEGYPIAPGYWFVAPYIGHDRADRDAVEASGIGMKGWRGPHIYTQQGELVWSPVEYEIEEIVNRVEASTLSCVDLGEGQGVEKMLTIMDLDTQRAILIDESYQIRRAAEVRGFNAHELSFVENGTKALTVYGRYDYEAPEEEVAQLGVGVEGKCKATCNGFVEYDVKTWEENYVWSSCPDDFGAGSIALNESIYTDGDIDMKQKCADNWDYVHANSVDLLPTGDYLFSCRHTDTIYKISHVDGSIIWHLGGVRNDFLRVGDFKFGRQHHIRYVHSFRGYQSNSTHTIISILDNASGQDHWDKHPSHPFSRGLVLLLDEASNPLTASIIGEYKHPDREYAFRRGNNQLLHNGNIFMGWSEEGLISEHHVDGTILMQARFQAKWLGSYRAFKYPGWVGMPPNPPDVVARAVQAQDPDVLVRTEIFVSWNGATEVASWDFYSSDSHGHDRQLLSSLTKYHFETRLEVVGQLQYVVVEAVASNGSTLATSKVAAVRLVSENELEDEDDWKSNALDTITNPVYIVSFVITVLILAGIGVGATCWAKTLKQRNRKQQFHRLTDLFRRRQDQTSSGRQTEYGGLDGGRPLLTGDQERDKEFGPGGGGGDRR